MSALQRRFIDSIYYIGELTTSDKGSKVQGCVVLIATNNSMNAQHSFYQTSDPDQHEKATPASSDGVAPKPASDNLPNQEDELMNTCGDN